MQEESIDIDLPSIKDILWHRMRRDLAGYIPAIETTQLLMCPTCCRFLPYEDFNLEHIIPLQAIADDPADVKAAIPKNERAAVTLLCKKRLLIKERVVYENGCNSWKGRHFDRFLREIFNARVLNRRTCTSRHSVALFAACYLGLVERYGFQITLQPSGLIMRRQFFNPNRFQRDVPLKCQMILMGEGLPSYSKDTELFWLPPFKFTMDSTGFCCVVVRNTSVYMPVARDPAIPIARILSLVPLRYKLRPNFDTIFR